MKLIKEAHQHLSAAIHQSDNIITNVNHLAKTHNTTPIRISESITHVLAGISQTAPNMHPKTAASLLAGVEALTQGLLKMQKPENALRVLQTAAMVRNDLTKTPAPNEATVKIAEFGAKFTSLVQKYESMINDPQELQKAANILSSKIQQAIIVASKQAAKTLDDNNPGQVMR